MTAWPLKENMGCKVFSASTREKLSEWLDEVNASMTPEHADGLKWAYPRYRNLKA